jgi:hypothetical protein
LNPVCIQNKLEPLGSDVVVTYVYGTSMPAFKIAKAFVFGV